MGQVVAKLELQVPRVIIAWMEGGLTTLDALPLLVLDECSVALDITSWLSLIIAVGLALGSFMVLIFPSFQILPDSTSPFLTKSSSPFFVTIATRASFRSLRMGTLGMLP